MADFIRTIWLNNLLEDIEKENKVHCRWVKKIEALSKEDRHNLFEKIIKKYNSKEYIDRERSIGRSNPIMLLYELILLYAERQNNEEIDFQEGYVLDDRYKITTYFNTFGIQYNIEILE